MSEPKWLVLARSELGVKEIAGEKDNQKIIQYSVDAKNDWVEDDETPWCAAFAGAMLERSGIVSTRKLNARSYLEWGTPVKLADAKPGDIVVFKRGKSGWEGHVAFFTKYKSGRIYHIGGNQTNEVNEASTAEAQLLGIRRPKTSTPAAVAKVADAVVTTLERIKASKNSITLAEYAIWLGESLSTENQELIRGKHAAMPDDTFRKIVSKNYWLPVSAEKYPADHAAFILDTAFAHGAQKTRTLIQKAVGTKADGIIGPKTIAAVKAMKAQAFIDALIEQRIADYKTRKDWDVNLPSWTQRMKDLRKEILGIVTATVKIAPGTTAPPNTTQVVIQPPAATAVVKPTTKPMEKTMSETTSAPAPAPVEYKPWSQSLTIWGTIVTFVSAVLPSLGQLLGWDISAQDVQSVGAGVTEIIQAVGGVIGTVMAVIGRVNAKAPVKFL